LRRPRIERADVHDGLALVILYVIIFTVLLNVGVQLVFVM